MILRCLLILVFEYLFIELCDNPARPRQRCQLNHSIYFRYSALVDCDNGNLGSMSTGTSVSLSRAFCISGLITPYLSSIALALSYDPSASRVRRSCVRFRTASLIFVGSMLYVAVVGLNLIAPSSYR